LKLETPNSVRIRDELLRILGETTTNSNGMCEKLARPTVASGCSNVAIAFAAAAKSATLQTLFFAGLMSASSCHD